jgi:ribosomal protein L17
MYTNEILEEKYKAQKELSFQAERENKDYLELIQDQVHKLFSEKGWQIKFSTRKGGFLKRNANADRIGDL